MLWDEGGKGIELIAVSVNRHSTMKGSYDLDGYNAIFWYQIRQACKLHKD
jgi:hypothetical protein